MIRTIRIPLDKKSSPIHYRMLFLENRYETGLESNHMSMGNGYLFRCLAPLSACNLQMEQWLQADDQDLISKPTNLNYKSCLVTSSINNLIQKIFLCKYSK